MMGPLPATKERTNTVKNAPQDEEMTSACRSSSWALDKGGLGVDPFRLFFCGFEQIVRALWWYHPADLKAAVEFPTLVHTESPGKDTTGQASALVHDHRSSGMDFTFNIAMDFDRAGVGAIQELHTGFFCKLNLPSVEDAPDHPNTLHLDAISGDERTLDATLDQRIAYKGSCAGQ